MKESFLESIGSTVVWKGTGKLLGLIKHILLASLFGLSAQIDVFFMAMGILGFIVFSWANMLDVISVPKLSEFESQKDDENFYKLNGSLLSLSILVALTILVLSYPNVGLITTIASGFEENRIEELNRALHIMLPVCLVYIPMRQFLAALKAKRKFSPTYKNEFLISLTTLGIIVVFTDNESILYISYLLAAIISFLYVSGLSLRYGFKLYYPFSNSAKSVLKVAPSLLLLQLVTSSYILVDRFFVSYMPTGGVGALSYAWIIICLLPSLINTSGSFIPVFVEKRNNVEQESEVVNKLLKLYLMIGIIGTAFLIKNSTQIVELLFEHGVFSSNETKMVSLAIMGYSLSILPLMLVDPLDQIFQVKERINIIVIRSCLGLFSNCILNYIFIFILKMGIFGIALATSISSSLMVLMGLIALNRFSIEITWKRNLEFGVTVTFFTIASLLISGNISKIVNNTFGILIEIPVYLAVICVLIITTKRKEMEIIQPYLQRIISFSKSKNKVEGGYGN